MDAGQVEGLFVAPTAKAPCEPRSEVEALPGQGLAGDRYAEHSGTWWKPGKSGQDITLIASETLERIRADEGIDLTPAETRRNVVTRGVDLPALLGKRFLIGEVECVGMRDCPPCAHLESLTHPGVHAALEGAGGLRAEIVTAGTLHVGDAIQLLD